MTLLLKIGALAVLVSVFAFAYFSGHFERFMRGYKEKPVTLHSDICRVQVTSEYRFAKPLTALWSSDDTQFTEYYAKYDIGLMRSQDVLSVLRVTVLNPGKSFPSRAEYLKYISRSDFHNDGGGGLSTWTFDTLSLESFYRADEKWMHVLIENAEKHVRVMFSVLKSEMSFEDAQAFATHAEQSLVCRQDMIAAHFAR